jgi:hypothetical protein
LAAGDELAQKVDPQRGGGQRVVPEAVAGRRPAAAGVLSPIGFVMPMSVGVMLMSLSTIVVALDAQLVRRLDLGPAASVAACTCERV